MVSDLSAVKYERAHAGEQHNHHTLLLKHVPARVMIHSRVKQTQECNRKRYTEINVRVTCGCVLT